MFVQGEDDRGPSRFTDDVGAVRQTGDGNSEEGWPSSRYHHAAWGIGGRLFVFGGLGTGPRRSTLELADLWQFSPGESLREKTHRLSSRCCWLPFCPKADSGPEVIRPINAIRDD